MMCIRKGPKQVTTIRLYTYTFVNILKNPRPKAAVRHEISLLSKILLPPLQLPLDPRAETFARSSLLWMGLFIPLLIFFKYLLLLACYLWMHRTFSGL